MSSDSAIEVSGISKKFIINHKNKASYSTIKDDFSNIFKKLSGRDINSSEEDFWALKDVSFNVPKGEVFGIIGQNGSGKSTLLKILSRIIEPTEGNIKIHGRLSSLLEVGTGFHPELTGRENIYFNGSMLGMSRAEINQKYKQIVEFSEVEKFIDTPVKFYSSGMYVRLAFSVAAHLNPDILVLDEVLAVGDASFQKKSLKKILETMQDGKTVVFVSHAMSSVRQLCTNGIMLDKGSVVAKGKIDSIIESYILENEKRASALLQAELGSVWEGTTNESDPDLNIYKTYITDENDKNVTSTLSNGKDYYINIVCEVKNITDQFNLGYTVWDDTGRSLLFMSFTTDMPRADWIKPSKGIHTYRAKIPKNTLAEGSYKIKIIASIYSKRWILDPDSSPVKISLTVRHADQPSPYWKENRGGLFVPIVSWDLKK